METKTVITPASSFPSDPANFSQLFRHTVPIFSGDRAYPVLIGNGVFTDVDQRYFIMTAAHVFEEGVRKIRFGVLDNGRLEIFGSDDTLVLKAAPQSEAGDPQRAVYKDELDIAVLEVSGQVLETLLSHSAPYNLRQRAGNSVSEWRIVSGWPARKNAYNRRKQRFDLGTCYHIQCPLVDEENIPTEWNRDIHFGLSADKARDFISEASGTPIQLPALEGLSGSGVWMRSADTAGAHNWHLAGLVIEDDTPRRMLKVIRAEHLWAPLYHGWRLKKQ